MARGRSRKTAEEGSDFGARVRRLRDDASMTLEDLAKASGVSRAMLSKVERGEKNPTIAVGSRIARGLGASFSTLAGAEADHRDVAVIRKRERLAFTDPESGFERHLLSPTLAGRAIEFVLHVIPPKAGSGALPAYPPGTGKYLVVDKGRLRVTIGGKPTTLETGDALYFEADVAHSFANAGDTICRYYLVVARRP